MSTPEYVQIPPCAKLIPDGSFETNLKSSPISLVPTAQVHTSLPHPKPTSEPQAASPQRLTFDLIPQVLLSSSIPSSPSSAVATKGNLLSTRDPLSIHITSINFKRFVAKAGPVFWVQDRIEEVLTWKKGWKRTVTWMAAYAFLCA